MRRKVLIIGAGFLQRYVIRKAKELGYYTLAVDGNPNAVGFADADEFGVVNIIDQEACLAYAREHRVDGVLTAATDYGVLSAAYIAQEMGLPGLKYAVAQTIKNKYKIRKCFFENCVDDTEQAYEVSADTDLEKLAQQIIYPVMVKPCDGSGSRGASRVDRAEDFPQACQFAMDGSITRRAVVETFIVGNEYGAESFVENGNIHILGVMRKWMTQPPYYAELGHAIPSGLKPGTEQYVRSCVEKAIKALGVNFGSVNMDMLITQDGKVYIVDVGARMGGNLIGSHIIPLGTGVDYMANMIRGAVGDPCDFTPKAHAGAVATRLLALSPGVVEAIPDMARYDAPDVIVEHHLSVGDRINEYHTNLDGCGYVVCTATGAEDAAVKAEKVKNEIDKAIIRA